MDNNILGNRRQSDLLTSAIFEPTNGAGIGVRIIYVAGCSHRASEVCEVCDVSSSLALGPFFMIHPY